MVAIGINQGVLLLSDDRMEEVISGKIGKITALRFLPDGETLIMGNDRGEVFSMTLDEGHAIESHQSHTAKITSIAYNPVNGLAATASRDGLVVIWNRNWDDLPLNTKVLNRTLGPVYNIAFTADGKYLVAGYDDGTILKWPTEMSMMANLICENVKDSLSEADWATYVKLDDLKRDDYGCTNPN
jgi:WD40 repeat protein